MSFNIGFQVRHLGLGFAFSLVLQSDCSVCLFAQLLKKCGWKEGTGLGVSEQGRLEPIQSHVKNNKHGLGAEKTKRKAQQIKDPPSGQIEPVQSHTKKKQKSLSKRLRKMQEEEALFKEKELEQAFYREFWPDDV